MKKYRFWKLCLVVAMVMMLALTGCSSDDDVAINPDTDGDGIPNVADALPNDAAKFVNNTTVALAGLTPAGGGFSAATAINNGGKAIGYSENAAGEIKAVRWDVTVTGGVADAPVITLAPAAGVANVYSAAYGINTAGATVGETEDGVNIVAAMWPADAADGAAATPLDMTGVAAPASAYAVNTTGQIAGEAMVGGALHAVCWNSATATPTDLGILDGGTFSAAYGINDSGVIVGEADVAGGAIKAVAWRVNPSGEKMVGPVDLGVITTGDVASIAFGIDSSGRVVGESETDAGVAHAGMWTLNATTLEEANKTDLGANGTAYAITDTNRIAGHLGTTDMATVWDTRKTTLPNNAVPETTFISQAFGLNEGNMVVGLQQRTEGTRAFVAVPVVP